MAKYLNLNWLAQGHVSRFHNGFAQRRVGMHRVRQLFERCFEPEHSGRSGYQFGDVRAMICTPSSSLYSSSATTLTNPS